MLAARTGRRPSRLRGCAGTEHPTAADDARERSAGFGSVVSLLLFTEVLGLEVVSADADFFALGGDRRRGHPAPLDAVAEDAGVRLAPEAPPPTPSDGARPGDTDRPNPTDPARPGRGLRGMDLPGPSAVLSDPGLSGSRTVAGLRRRCRATVLRGAALRPRGSRPHRSQHREARRRLLTRRHPADPAGRPVPARRILPRQPMSCSKVARDPGRDGRSGSSCSSMIDLWAPVISHDSVARRLRVKGRWE